MNSVDMKAGAQKTFDQQRQLSDPPGQDTSGQTAGTSLK